MKKFPDRSERHFREIIAETRLADPLTFPPLTAVMWVPENGPPIAILWNKKTLKKNLPVYADLAPNISFIEGNFFVLNRFLEVEGSKGHLLLQIPLRCLLNIPLFTIVGVEKAGPQKYAVPIPRSSQILLLQAKAPSYFWSFFQAHLFSLLLFVFFACGTAASFILYGRELYFKALSVCREKMDGIQKRYQDINDSFSFEKSRNSVLDAQHKVFVETAQNRESLITEVLLRQRLMREKAYLRMLLLVEDPDNVDEKAFADLISDIQHHFGYPQVAAFSVRTAVQRVMDIFAQELEKNLIKLTLTNHMKGDTLESDPLIFAMVLANLLNRCIVRVPHAGQIHITLSRKTRGGFKIHIMDDGYPEHGLTVLSQVSKRKFFFLETEPFGNICASIQAKITIKDRADLKGLNSLTLEVPLKIHDVEPPLPEKVVLPDNVIRFPRRKRKSREQTEWSDPA